MSVVSNPVPTPFQPRSNPLFAHTPYTPGSVRTLGGMRTSLPVVPMPGFLCRTETDRPTVLFSLRKKSGGSQFDQSSVAPGIPGQAFRVGKAIAAGWLTICNASRSVSARAYPVRLSGSDGSGRMTIFQTMGMGNPWPNLTNNWLTARVG